ncbi:two-partner secretion domain-containing protein [Aliarcobacter lanthieri]|uniref:two-partner secretion domain-containing protein n=1 Tax=Aliarcobacter lanthieri TaxID=1355374 RepID=UPI0004792651|nr:MBG domain-containing protein [Aliarcobacter lanthieri]
MKKVFEFSSRFRILKGGLISLVVASNLYGAPSGGTVVNGTATINQVGNTTNINQSTNKSIINWQSFNIANGETVNFNQPNSNSITLNRVVGSEKSIIDGALNANGQVWLINSNGILFGKNAKVNTSGILASTKDILNEDFLNGNYNFKGNSKATILNEGEIKSLEKTYATFIANSVTNKGKIEVHKGTIHLVGASDINLTLDDNSNISLKVNKGVLDALIENDNLIVANGGNVYLTTNAKNELLKGVVNNSGIIEANSIDNLKSEVIVFAHGGKANISGTIEAKNGFVETSGKSLNVTDGAKITTGTWLIDPVNVTIESNGGSNLSGESISATAIKNALGTGSVIIQADENIYVNEDITYSENFYKFLNLRAGDSIYFNSIVSVDNKASLVLDYGNNYYFGKNGKINLTTTTQNGFMTKKNGESEPTYWTVIKNATDLQNMNNNKAGNYVLGTDIDLTGLNWIPIGSSIENTFSGKFDGLGHTILNLKMESTLDNQGLFGYINGGAITTHATIRNIGLLNVDIAGNRNVGGLVGNISHGSIYNSYVTGKVRGNQYVGGLAGNLSAPNSTNISNAYSTANVTGNNRIGGLVGSLGALGAKISNSHASGIVIGNNEVGGLLGTNYHGIITNSYSTGNIIGTDMVGGLIGRSYGLSVINSYSSGTVTGDTKIGGLIGQGAGVSSSFYDKTVNPTLTENHSNVGKTTSELQNINTFKNAGWDIVEDSSLAEGTPILRDGKWYIKPTPIISLVYNLDTKTKTYNGQNIFLSSLWNSSTIFGVDYASWILGTDYNFVDSNNNILTSYINAGTYNNILIQVLKSGYETANTGNSVGSLVINKADLSVISSSGSKTYDGLYYTNTINYDGFVNNENQTVLTGILSGKISEKNAGTYTTNLSGLNSDNYNIKYKNGTYTISKKIINLAVDSKSKKQGEENPQLTYVANGLIDGDTLNVILQTNATTTSPAGTYTIWLDSSVESANKNYDVSYQGAYLFVLAQVEPKPQPQPEPQPNMQKIVDSIDRITHINTTEYQSTNNIQDKDSSKIDINQNVEVIALSSNQNIRIIDGGIKMPENIAIDINLDENDK